MTFFVVYNAAHVDEAEKRLGEGYQILCVDFLAERKLNEAGVPFLSLPVVLDKKEGEERWWVLSHEISREWYRQPSMSFFTYRGIRVAEAPEPIMQSYLARLFYFVRIYGALKGRYPNAKLLIPAPVLKQTEAAYCLTTFASFVSVDAARMARVPFQVLGDPPTRPTEALYQFPPPSWKSWLFRLYNALMGLLPRRAIRIYSSEYWTHLAPVIPYLKNTELVLLERKGLKNIPWRLLLKHRIRVRYPSRELSGARAREVEAITKQFQLGWGSAKAGIASYLEHIDASLDWSPVVEACEYLVSYAPRVVADIDAFYELMHSERPDLILQMASVGGPEHYFFLMAAVARELSIPSLELQHATATIDPRSVYSRIETTYLATYGAEVNKRHENLGHERSRLLSVGSPRFDAYVNDHARGVEEGKERYAALGLDPTRPVVLAAVPNSAACVCMCTPNSYGLAEFFEVMHEVQRQHPGLQVLFKFRRYNHIGEWRDYLRELFEKDYVIASEEPIFPLLCASNVVVCNWSTVLYEAILARKPLVLYPWRVFDTYHAEVYASLLPLRYTKEEAVTTLSKVVADQSYRHELLDQQQEFLKHYRFDGHSSERVAALLMELAKGK